MYFASIKDAQAHIAFVLQNWVLVIKQLNTVQ